MSGPPVPGGTDLEAQSGGPTPTCGQGWEVAVTVRWGSSRERVGRVSSGHRGAGDTLLPRLQLSGHSDAESEQTTVAQLPGDGRFHGPAQSPSWSPGENSSPLLELKTLAPSQAFERK